MTKYIKRIIIYSLALILSLTSFPHYQTEVNAAPPIIDCSDQSSEGLAKIRDFYRLNDITGYDVCAQLVSDYCPPGGTASSTVPSGNTNAEKLFKFLVGKGLTARQASGIIGNVMQESGGGTFDINPDATNPLSGAYGIVQWYAARKTGLQSYAGRVGKPVNDLGVQFDYLWIELSGINKATVLDPIRATSDLRAPTRIFLERFEIPCTPGSAACVQELNKRMEFTQSAYSAFNGLSSEQLGAVDIANPTCINGGGSGIVDASGYAFPLALGKSLISNGYTWPCRTSSPYCHHDATPAFDLFKKPDNKTTGVSVVAIYPGKIVSIGHNYQGTGCQSIQYAGDDGHNYWYGHIRTDSKTPRVGASVSAGSYLGRVGERICTGNGSDPHLHIDMAYKGRTAGYTETRDPTFVPLMNKLYENLPEGR